MVIKVTCSFLGVDGSSGGTRPRVVWEQGTTVTVLSRVGKHEGADADGLVGIVWRKTENYYL